MPTIYVRLDPRKLDNPDADLRYSLPDLICEESCGEVKDDGYDYVGDVPFLLLFLKAENIDRGLAWVLSVLEHDRTLQDDFLLRAAAVAVERDGQKTVVYPKDFVGEFPV